MNRDPCSGSDKRGCELLCIERKRRSFFECLRRDLERQFVSSQRLSGYVLERLNLPDESSNEAVEREEEIA